MSSPGGWSRRAPAPIIALLLVLAWPASWAQPEALLAAGRFADAYREAVAVGGATDLVLAARAASFQAVYGGAGGDDRRAGLQRAQAAATRAVELAPESPEARFELARAEGLLATTRSALANLETALRLKALFDAVLALDPNHPDALVALAQWHLELDERGVAWLYRADRREVVPLFERAVAVAPRTINLRVEYATALERLGLHEDARRQLEYALTLPTLTSVDVLEQQRAQRLLTCMD